ncbi:dihydroxyacetone kinase subunit L [Treponema socranskii]|uniref:dihydroxyacetone kinase subunit DhaL n=1 Tax=Treponema socranskii TaxID=53419 RepID=UPI003D90C4F1
MKNDLNAADLKKMFLFTAQKIVDSEPYLTEIDSVIGDGDHGTGMALGFSYVIKELPQKKCESAEDVVSSVGLILIDTMGGASGVLFGTMFISGIVNREKHETLDLCGFAEIFRKSLDALKKRGKAKVGDKTMIDAFEPAVCGLEEAAAKRWSLADGFALAAQKAEAGTEYTKTVRAKFGRAKYYGDKSIGLQDPGAVSVRIIFQAMSEWIQNYAA